MTSIPGNSMTFNPAKRDSLRLCYQQAIIDQSPSFEFEGTVLDTNYAAYLLLYLDAKFQQLKDHPQSR